MQKIFVDKFERYSSFLTTDEQSKEIMDDVLHSFGANNRREFISFFQKKDFLGLFQPSIPRFPEVRPFIQKDITDPSKRFVPITEMGKSLDEALIGYSMANSKVRCVTRDKILFREDYKTMAKKVRIISSGIGLWGDFVGRGMLTCMVMGTYGSPKPRVIYTALRELSKTEDYGVLAIIPNNYDDKLNWGIAIARALRKGMQIDFFTFGDNAYQECKVDERNCLAGVVFCYKMAGAMCEEKRTLSEIANRLKMMFITTISCHFGDTIHIGADLCGNGGVEMKDNSKRAVIREVVSCLVDPSRKYSVGYDPGAEFVIFVNSYTDNWFLSLMVTIDVLQRIYKMGHNCVRVYTGHLVSSVSEGFSVTILPEGDDQIVEWLDSFTSCAGWLVGGTGRSCKYSISKIPPLPKRKGTCLNKNQASMMRRLIELAATNFKNAESYLNANDPQKSYGTNMCKITCHLIKGLELNTLLIDYPYILFTTIAECFESIFNNVDGVMFAIFFTTLGQFCGDHVKAPKYITDKFWQRALKRSVKSVASYFKVGYKDNTALDIFGSLYMIMASSHLDVFTDLHLALEVGEQQCWKAKYAKSKNIINSPYASMKTAYIILETIAIMLRESQLNAKQLSIWEIDTTPTLTAERIKDILTSN